MMSQNTLICQWTKLKRVAQTMLSLPIEISQHSPLKFLNTQKTKNMIMETCLIQKILQEINRIIIQKCHHLKGLGIKLILLLNLHHHQDNPLIRDDIYYFC